MAFELLLHIGVILAGGISAYFMFVSSLGEEKIRALTLGHLFLRPNRLTTKMAVLRRARFLARIAMISYSLTPIIVLFLLATVIIPACIFGYLGGIFGFIITTVFFKVILGQVDLGWFDLCIPSELLKVAVRNVVRVSDTADSIDFLLLLSSNQYTPLREEAIKGIAQLPADLALKYLSDFQNDSNEVIAELATKLHDQIMQVQMAASNEDAEAFSKLIATQHRFRTHIIARILDWRRVTYKMETTSIKIDQYLWRNFPLKGNASSYYCNSCKCFAKTESYAEWSWIACRKCKRSNDLQAGIQKVVGQIGADKSYALAEKTMQLSLWNSTAKHAEAADINTLEIIGGKNIDYDWAINAVLENLQSKGAMVRDFKLVVKGKPALSRNSIRLLNEFAGKQLPQKAG